MEIPEYTPWVDHIYAALRWTEGSARKLHELLEVEGVDAELRGRVARVFSWIDGARRQTFFALEKISFPGEANDQAKIDISSIGNETKVKVLRLNAAFIGASIESPEGRKDYESLRRTMVSVVQTLKQQADEIESELKRGLEGPPESER